MPTSPIFSEAPAEGRKRSTRRFWCRSDQDRIHRHLTIGGDIGPVETRVGAFQRSKAKRWIRFRRFNLSQGRQPCNQFGRSDTGQRRRGCHRNQQWEQLCQGWWWSWTCGGGGGRVYIEATHPSSTTQAPPYEYLRHGRQSQATMVPLVTELMVQLKFSSAGIRTGLH